MFVAVDLTVQYYLKQGGQKNLIDNVKVEGSEDKLIIGSSKTYVGFSKKTMNQNFADKFGKMLKQLKEDGTVAKIEKRYKQ